LRPGAAIILIMTRWHEDDLAEAGAGTNEKTIIGPAAPGVQKPAVSGHISRSTVEGIS
jgi:hypothetical protein